MGSTILSSSLSKKNKKNFKNSLNITKMNRGDLILIATVDSFKNSRSISGVGSGFLQANQLDNFGSVKLDNFPSVKLDPTPFSEQNQIIHKIMVNWSGSDICTSKASIPTTLIWDGLEFLEDVFQKMNSK